jgi:hypothetical protein
MNASLYLKAQHSASFMLPPESEEARRARREAEEQRREGGGVGERRRGDDTAEEASFFNLFPAGHRDASKAAKTVATPSFDDLGPTALALPNSKQPSRRPLRAPAAKPRTSSSAAAGESSEPQRQQREGDASWVDTSVNIPDAAGAVPFPEKHELRVRYRPQHGPVAVRSRLCQQAGGGAINPIVSTSAPAKARLSKPAAAPLRKSSAGPRRDGSEKTRAAAERSMNVEAFATCMVSNPLPQTDLHPSTISAPMQLLRVAISHLRTVGALPYLLDVDLSSPHFAKLTVAPQEMHAVEFASIPVSVFRIFPVVGKTRLASDGTRMQRFEALPQAQETDAVLAFAFDSKEVRENPWEPSFIETDCRHRFFTGPTSALGGKEMAQHDWEAHRAAIAVDSARVHGYKASLGQLDRRYPRDLSPIQAAFYPFDACCSDLPQHGFSTTFSWEAFAQQLNAAAFVAVHRVWYIMRYRQEHNKDGAS